MSLSMASVAILSPFLGGIADYGGLRKRMMFFFMSLCVISVACFSFLRPGDVIQGFILIILANTGFEGCFVFYNSFLPLIVHRRYTGRVSSWGYGTGYAGSILSLLIALFLVERKEYSLIWIMVSLFFLIFSIPAFLYLPPDRRRSGIIESARKGFDVVWNTFKNLWKDRRVRRFLISYFFYIDGVNTVIIFSSIYAASTLGFTQKELVILFILVQFTALLGAYLFSVPVDLWGPKKIIELSILLWIGISFGAFFVYEKISFFIIALLAGVGLGTIQASSRALFSNLIAHGHESEYFGVYSLAGKASAITGPFLFGLISPIYGERPGIAVISILFIIGLVIIRKLKMDDER